MFFLILIVQCFAVTILANQESLDSLQNSKVKVENVTTTNQPFNDTLLASLKLPNFQNRPAQKKKLFPGIVLQNDNEKSLTDDISDDLTKFEAYSKLLSKLMHSIADKDLGVGVMQKALQSLNVSSVDRKFVDILDEITDKVINYFFVYFYYQ